MKTPLRLLSLPAKVKLAAGLVAAAATAAVVPTIGDAFAASGPAPVAPTISSGPTGLTNSAIATFKYTHPQNVTFKCSLDGADYKTCSSSGITYSSLASGSHTFRVAAQQGGSELSAPATRTWTIDRDAPAISVSFPSGAHNAAAWAAGCPTPGICGTASDANGVQSVSVSIRQASSGKYWNGSAFAASSAVYQSAIGTTSWGYALAVPADGSYSVSVRATDGLGNLTPSSKAATVEFSIDTVTPPAPVLTKTPEDPTFDTSPHFQFNDGEANVGFTCSLDGAPASGCAGEVVYKDVDTTDHCFEVRAVDAAGNTSAPTSFCWTVVLRKSFGVSGSVPQPFHPGASRPVDLVITNPFNFDIAVLDVTITVTGVTRDGQPNPACVAADNMVTAQPFTGPVVVPRNSTKSLSELAVPASQWPVLQMPNQPYNQDACKSSTFSFAFSGTATKP